MWTLVLNCGSSSVKFALLDPETGQVQLEGLAERLNTKSASVVAQLKANGEKIKQTVSLENGSYAEAFAVINDLLQTLNLKNQVGAVGHRVVHGGNKFSSSVLINAEVMEAIKACIPLAPLHNPANIAGIDAAMAAFPNLPHIAVFDTAFHQTMPEVAYRYAVPTQWYSQFGVRRYGFHGTSHAYVAQEGAKFLGKPLAELNLITAHLGNGCSVAAVQGGHSIDTSMGLTPLEGLVMGTRSGDLDPSLHEFMANAVGLSLAEIGTALNKESGLLGLSGLSNDMRELEQHATAGHAGAKLAISIFIYRLAKYIAAMAVALGRVDGLIFTGGIGENSASVRAATLQRLGVLNFKLDEQANALAVRGRDGLITTKESLPALVIHTNEEWMIARETADTLAHTPAPTQGSP